MSFQIRMAGSGDLERILDGAELFCSAIKTDDFGLKFSRDGARPFFNMMISSPMFVIYLAENDNGILGGIGASIVPWFCNTKHMLIDELFWWVFPEARGLMVGPTLHKALERFAIDSGASSISMSLMLGAENAERLSRYYEKKLGYVSYEQKFVKKIGE